MTKMIRARIAYMDSPESPREWTNNGTFVGFEHRNYNIGDRRPTPEEMTALENGGWEALEKHLKRTYGALVILRVGMLDHSGVMYYVGGGAHWSDSAGWDSGTCGYIFDTKAQRDETGCPEDVEIITKALTEEIETYSQWANGDVYMRLIETRTLCGACQTLYDADPDDLPEDCPHCAIDDDGWLGEFYGWDWETNGILEELEPAEREAMKETAKASDIESGYSNKIHAHWEEIPE